MRWVIMISMRHPDDQPVTRPQHLAAPLDFSAIVRLLRPRQWVKNVFVCAGLLFGGQWRDPKLFGAMALAFIAFSLMGSAVYVFNDYCDRESDRRHPLKHKRPLASGAVTVPQGFVAAAVCLGASLVAAGFADLRVVALVIGYLLINVAYSLGLKSQPVIDIFCISAGFMLRIVAGTLGIHIAPSGWLILSGVFITLFLGFGKRRAEWMEPAGTERRPVLAAYSRELLDTFLSITATGTALSYGLYTLDPQTVAIHHTDRLILTLPLVLFALFRYLYLLHSGHKGQNPGADAFTDPQILICVLLYGVSALWLLSP
jgi:4-hydroxybenzoate polyprenyltransferase